MSAASESRWKARNLEAFHGATRLEIEREVLCEGREPRALLPHDTQPIATRAEARRWMRLHAHEFDTSTALAEACNAALPLTESALDPDGWAWDVAFEEAGRP